MDGERLEETPFQWFFHLGLGTCTLYIQLKKICYNISKMHTICCFQDQKM